MGPPSFGDAPRDADAWVTVGTATARTRLGAFDAALASAGIHDANLVRISSIIPAASSCHRDVDPGTLADRIHPGELVPAVYARAESRTPGEAAHAAVGGVRLEEGYGLLVEQHGTGETAGPVRRRCEDSLVEMARTREQSMASDPWVQLASVAVPEEREPTWAGAVAAVVFL